MKKNILIIAALLIGLTAFSQEMKKPGSKNDTTKIKFGKSIIMIYDYDKDNDDYDHDFGKCDSMKMKKKEGRFFMDFGVNGYMTKDYDISLPDEQEMMEVNYARSFNFGFTFMHHGAHIVKDRLYVTSGLGANWNNYFFKNNVNVSTSNDSTMFSHDSVIDYDKYKLSAVYLQVPIIIGARIGNVDNPFGIQAGVIGSYKVGSWVKQKYSVDDARYKGRIRDDYNINPFQLDAIARLSVGGMGIYARYSLTTLFENNKAPELYPFSVGITLGNF